MKTQSQLLTIIIFYLFILFYFNIFNTIVIWTIGALKAESGIFVSCVILCFQRISLSELSSASADSLNFIRSPNKTYLIRLTYHFSE